MLRIVDAHVHLFDAKANTHAFLEQEDPSFKAIAGDYSALPRRFSLDDYLKASAWCRVDGIVWYEFLSADPIGEAQWAQRLASASPMRQSMVVRVDFLDPALEHRLEAYAALSNVVAVREHLGWDSGDSLRRFAKRPDLLTDPQWRKGLGALRRHGFQCGLEVFAPQLPDVHDVVRLQPDIGFTLGVMGWPLDLSPTGFARWRQDVTRLGSCPNVYIEIAAIECIFGLGWRQDQVAPWLLTLVETFGPGRCMFGSHMPISALSVGSERLYDAYQDILSGFSQAERDSMFSGTAAAWFRLC